MSTPVNDVEKVGFPALKRNPYNAPAANLPTGIKNE